MPLSTTTTVLLIIAIIIAWVPFWMWLCLMIARASGWRQLAAAYPAPLPERSPAIELADPQTSPAIWRWQSLAFRGWFGYNNIVRVAAEQDGLRLEVPWMFRAGHRPILIPWGDLAAQRRQGRLFTRVFITAAKLPRLPIAISAKLAGRLRAARPRDWPEKTLL